MRLVFFSTPYYFIHTISICLKALKETEKLILENGEIMKSFEELFKELQTKVEKEDVTSGTVKAVKTGKHGIGKKLVEEAAEVWMAAEHEGKEKTAEEIKAENIIEMAKWAEGKACATTIATALRAYAAENGTNGDYKNITVQKLFDTPYDLMGKYFNINNYELSDISFDATRTEQPLHYTITVTRPDDSWKIKSFKLLYTGQWIQTP